MSVTASTVRRRRAFVFCLNLTTYAVTVSGLAVFLARGGISVSEWIALAGFMLTMPYTALGFWNALIGLTLRYGRADPGIPLYGFNAPEHAELPRVDGFIAIVMTLRNEAPEAIFARLAWIRESLIATGYADRFQFVVLSDTDMPAIAAKERRCMAAFAADDRMRRPIYRLRSRNVGYKAGNIGEFLDACADDYRFFVPLDSDSVMSGPVIVRLVAALEAHPEIGILQSLAVGMPSASGFTRIFQFGMRHAMRVFTTGAAWWTADCGAYWGHNAVVRTAAFSRYCRLPRLPGRSALGGAILSHDQLEAVFMRRAGYEVRVLPVETDSFEINPPTLLDFIRRELRWCQGNMQYGRFVFASGLKAVSRWQLAQAMLMYIAPPAWIGMSIAACVGALTGGFQGGDPTLGLALFFAVLGLAIAPKLAGVVDVVLARGGTAAYGGGPRFYLSVGLELAGSTLMAPIVAVSITLFLIGLFFGRTMAWRGQNRDACRVAWRTAGLVMVPHTLTGAGIAAIVFVTAGPAALVWSLPFVGGLLGAIPLTVVTASPRVGRLLTHSRLFMIPEENKRRV